MLLVLLFLTGPLAFMPEAVLSAVVFHIGVDLIDVAGMRKIYRQRRSGFWVALLTLLMVVFVGVEQAIILAVILSLVDHTRSGYRPQNVLLKATESDTQLKDVPVASKAQALPGLMIYRFPIACITQTPRCSQKKLLSWSTMLTHHSAGFV